MNKITAMQGQIDALAADMGVEVRQEWNLPGMMYVEYEPPLIDIPTLAVSPRNPTVECAYVTALHELGHVFYGHTQGRPPHTDKRFYFDNGVLRSEAEAWNYALDHCEHPLGRAEFDFMWSYCLASYLRSSRLAAGQIARLTNGNRHHIEFHWDTPDQYFWDTKERMAHECAALLVRS